MEEDTIFTFQVDAAEADAGLSEVEDAIAGVGEVFDELAASAEDMSAAVTESLGGMAESATPLDEAMSALADTVAALTASLASITDSASSAAASLSEVDGAAAGAAASLAGVGDAADAADAGMAGMNLGPLHMVGLAALVAGGAFIKMGADGSDALTRVQALTGASNDQMAQYSSTIDQMAGTYGKSVSDLAGGLYDVVSVGFQGSDALNTLKVAAEGAAAGGVDLHTVTSGLTSIMKAFGVDGAHASTVMDTLLLGVRDGKASFQDYSNAIGLVAVSAKGAGFSLDESAAALSTLTAVFPNARRAGMDLQHLMTQLGVNSAKVGEEAKKMGLKFNQSAFNSDTLQQKLLYLQKITGGNQAEMLKLTGGTAGYAAAQVLLANKSADFTRNLHDMKNATGSTKNAFDIWHQSIGAHAEDMMGSLSSLAHQFTVLAGPAIVGALSGLSGAFSALDAGLQKLNLHDTNTQAILIVIAGVIGGVLVAALTMAAIAAWAFVAPLLVAAAPFILIGLAIGLVVAGLFLLWTHWKQIGAWLSGVWNAIVSGVGGFFHWLGDEAGKLWAAITGHFHAGAAKVGGAMSALGGFFTGLWSDIQGIFKKAVAVITFLIFGWVYALVGLFSWLYNHNYYFKALVDGIRAEFERAKQLVMAIWNGITGWLAAAWNKLKTMAQAAFAFVVAVVRAEWLLVERFIIQPVERVVKLVLVRLNEMKARLELLWNAVVTRVQGAWDQFIGVITGVASRIGSAVQQNIITPITNAVTGLISGATAWGQNLIKNLISGIQNMAGAVGNAAQGVAKNIASFLGFHSPTEEGPGAESDQWMPNLGRMLEAGLAAQVERVRTQARAIAAAVAGALQTGAQVGVSVAGPAGSIPRVPTLPAPSLPPIGALASGSLYQGGAAGLTGALGGSNPAVLALLARIAHGVSQNGQLGPSPLPAQLGSVSQNFGGININGVQNINQLYAQLAALAGLALEDGARGVVGGTGY